MQYSEAAARDVLWKKVFLEISQNLHENISARVSLLIKLQASDILFLLIRRKIELKEYLFYKGNFYILYIVNIVMPIYLPYSKFSRIFLIRK